MKYQCEICGVTFPNEQECIKHEKECRFKNAVLINITTGLAEWINAANVQKIILGVEIPVTDKDEVKKEFFFVNGVEYSAAKNRITIKVKPNESKDTKPVTNSEKKK